MLKLELDILGTVYKAESENIADGLLELNVPKILKFGILRVKDGKKKAELKVNPRQINRCRFNELTRQILQKRINLMLK